MMGQMFSIGKRSGLQAGQFSTRTLLLRSHAVVIAAVRGALMHGLQGAEAQGPTLERGTTGCRQIIFF